MTRSLWRLSNTDAPPIRPHSLQDGVALHLTHTDVVSVLVQISAHQQAYLVLHGCNGCQDNRCVPGCYRTLFARLLHATWPAVQLAPVRRSLIPRPYTRTVIAWPTPQAQLLDSTLLHSWHDARLLLHWHHGRRGATLAALLHVGADGEDSGAALARRGWWAWAVPSRITGQMLKRPMPPALYAHRLWTNAPYLLRPHATPDGHVEQPFVPEAALRVDGATVTLATRPLAQSAGQTDAPDDASLTSWLRGVLHAELVTPTIRIGAFGNRTIPIEETDGDGRVWPHGPRGMAPLEVAALVQRLVTAPRLHEAAQISQRGLTKNRLIKWFALSET